MDRSILRGVEVTSSIGSVAAEADGAAEAGAHMLAVGGNAMDAAAAAVMASCVLRPEMTGIAGYMLAAVVLDGNSDEVWSLDSNSTAPAAASEEMYEILPIRDGPVGINEDEYLCSVADDANLYGGTSVGVPGVLAGIGALSERWGRLKWGDVVAPSIELAENGFAFGPDLVGAITQMESVLSAYPDTSDWLMPDGCVPEPDDVCHRTDLAATLRRVSEHGWRDLYEGDLAERMITCVNNGGGQLCSSDLRSFAPRVTEPYNIGYRDASIYGPVLPNGCVSSMQLLSMANCFDPRQDDSLEYWHRLAELLKLTWQDRLRYLGDPEFVDVPLDRLLSHEHALERTAALRANPNSVDASGLEPGESRHGTLHVSVADAEGNVVAVTFTHGAAFGSCTTVPGTGMLLGHGMSRLDPRPGHVNSVAPGKRPLNNVAPMIIRLPDRDVAIGLPGGRRIVSVGAQIAQRVVDFGSSSLAAATAPRMHYAHESLEVTSTLDPDIVAGLEGMGHVVNVVDNVGGGAQCAEFLKAGPNTRAGGSRGRAAAVQ